MGKQKNEPQMENVMPHRGQFYKIEVDLDSSPSGDDFEDMLTAAQEEAENEFKQAQELKLKALRNACATIVMRDRDCFGPRTIIDEDLKQDGQVFEFRDENGECFCGVSSSNHGCKERYDASPSCKKDSGANKSEPVPSEASFKTEAESNEISGETALSVESEEAPLACSVNLYKTRFDRFEGGLQSDVNDIAKKASGMATEGADHPETHLRKLMGLGDPAQGIVQNVSQNLLTGKQYFVEVSRGRDNLEGRARHRSSRNTMRKLVKRRQCRENEHCASSNFKVSSFFEEISGHRSLEKTKRRPIRCETSETQNNFLNDITQGSATVVDLVSSHMKAMRPHDLLWTSLMDVVSPFSR